MWLLDSISRVPFQRPYLILTGVLGAIFMLLAHFLSLAALFEPVTYALLATALLLGFGSEIRLRNAALFTLVCTVLAFALFPAYRLLFAIAYAFLIGKWVFPQTFRVWKWLVAAALFLISVEMVAVLQRFNLTHFSIPPFLHPLAHSALFAFCMYCSFLLYAVRKDAVSEAYDHYSWNSNLDAASLAQQTLSLYRSVRIHADLPKSAAHEDLENCTEKMIHLCHQLQEMTAKLDSSTLATVQHHTAELREKVASIVDPVAKLQYEQAVKNKEKQLQQMEDLQNRQERLRGQILNYNSALETMQLAYSNRGINSAGMPSESVDLFMDIARARVENLETQ